MKKKQYTDLQLRIISGEVPIEDVSSSNITRLINTAQALGDIEIAERFIPYQQKNREAYRLKNNEQTRKRYHEKYKGKDAPIMPKVTNSQYTSRQKQIILGIIPYEEASSRDYMQIAAKALLIGDLGLASQMEILGQEKYNDYKERNRKVASERYYKLRGEEPGRKRLFDWEERILESKVDPQEYGTNLLEAMFDVAKKCELKEYIKVVEFLLAERKNRSIVYAVQTKAEALALIEHHTICPIRWPEEWFANEKPE